jgi:LAO/AO transport system kinase
LKPDLSTRAGLGRAITLVESRRATIRPRRARCCREIMPLTGKAQRIGITGVPGVGKSTFIEASGRC